MMAHERRNQRERENRMSMNVYTVQFNCCDIVFAFGGGEDTWNDKIEEHRE